MVFEFKWAIIIAFNELGPEIAFFVSKDSIFLYLAGAESLQR